MNIICIICGWIFFALGAVFLLFAFIQLLFVNRGPYDEYLPQIYKGTFLTPEIKKLRFVVSIFLFAISMLFLWLFKILLPEIVNKWFKYFNSPAPSKLITDIIKVIGEIFSSFALLIPVSTGYAWILYSITSLITAIVVFLIIWLAKTIRWGFVDYNDAKEAVLPSTIVFIILLAIKGIWCLLKLFL